MEIVAGHGAEYVPAVRVLFEEYAAALEVDLPCRRPRGAATAVRCPRV